MLQDNEKSKVQFCRELGTKVYDILSNSKELLSVFEELSELYKPKSRKEADKFYSLRFDLLDSVGLLCDLRKIDMPDDEEFYDAVAPLRDMALDVAVRMVSANVIINDVINMYVEPHDDDMYIHLYLPPFYFSEIGTAKRITEIRAGQAPTASINLDVLMEMI